MGGVVSKKVYRYPHNRVLDCRLNVYGIFLRHKMSRDLTFAARAVHI